VVCYASKPVPLTHSKTSANDRLVAILAELEIETSFSEDVEREVKALVAAPGLADPSLEDLTVLPFVTIDGPTSRDLDQAIHVAREPDGYLVRYALADAAHFAPAKSALFREALRRGASYYLPGLSVPMLPRELSEGLVSLNPGVHRRALTFEMRVGDDGTLRETRVTRARIASRRKLAFGDVQGLYDAPGSSPLAREDFAPSLAHLRELGELLLENADAREVARFRRRETTVVAGGDRSFSVVEEPRLDVERYNEQVSLLTNREGGRLLRDCPATHLQPVYRVHPPPTPERIAALVELTRGVAACHGLDVPGLVHREGETLSRYLEGLPTDPALSRIVRAVERQVILVNTRSSFGAAPEGHFGVGAEVYARFSAPMREVVGVFLHKELLELCDPRSAADSEIDERLRAEVIDAANRSKQTQRGIDERVMRLVLDALFGADLARPQGDRPRRSGTVMGFTSSKIHVALDAPAIDVKVYVRDLAKQHGGAWLSLAAGGAALRNDQTGEFVCRLGDAVTVRTAYHDRKQDRWALILEPAGSRSAPSS
jgi:ribonuclease R